MYGASWDWQPIKEDFSEIAAPLHQLTEKDKKFSWDDACNQAFQQLKEYLMVALILAYPTKGQLFILDCDANTVIGHL